MKIVALKRILGLYHAKECDEVDLDKQIANLGFDFKNFHGFSLRYHFTVKCMPLTAYTVWIS